MDILFSCGLFPPQIIKEIESNSIGSIQYAANSLQWNFVRGIDANIKNAPIQIISAPLIGSFPFFFRKSFIKRTEFQINKLKGISVGFWNLSIIKNYFIKKAIIKESIKWANHNNENTKIIIVYGMLSSWVLAAIKVKEKYPAIKLCLIVPDLPEFMSNSKSYISKIRGYFQPNLYKHITLFDAFVFLTDEMSDHFNIQVKPWVRIEGMINPHEIRLQPINNKAINKVIMYSGTLAERYGILDLLEAFQEIDDTNYELWICGSGNTQELIKSKALIDSRIKYFGLLPREQVIELQQRATVLVNPRNSEGEYTKYSFPSKIMEYLLSGTPCIMKPLPGIPNEYNEYVFLVDDDSLLSLKNKILEVCSLDNSKLKAFGEAAREFVLEKKNYIVQTKKMTNMLNSLDKL